MRSKASKISSGVLGVVVALISGTTCYAAEYKDLNAIREEMRKIARASAGWATVHEMKVTATAKARTQGRDGKVLRVKITAVANKSKFTCGRLA